MYLRGNFFNRFLHGFKGHVDNYIHNKKLRFLDYYILYTTSNSFNLFFLFHVKIK